MAPPDVYACRPTATSRVGDGDDDRAI